MPDDTSWERLGHHISESLKSLTNAVEKLEIVLVDLQKSVATTNTTVNTLTGDFREIRVNVEKLKEDMAVMKVKSGVWGAVAGIVAALAAILIQKIK